MKYFRYYPWGLRLILFLLMVFTMAGFASFLVYTLLPRLTSYTVLQLTSGINGSSPQPLVNASLIVQGTFTIFMFLLPAFLFAYLTHPKPLKYLGLQKPGSLLQVLLVVLMMLGAMPVLEAIGGLVGKINFGAKIRAEQDAYDQIFKAYLYMPDFVSFLRTFTVLALLPAIGEEMFFRGVFLRFAKQRSTTMAFPIIFTALIFSYSHTNVYGYLSIFLAGVLLAVIYNLTGSLWCSIIAHLFFNGTQVVLAYAGNSSKALKDYLSQNDTPIYLIAGGAILFAGSFYLLLKNKTPLPANWTNDFSPEELTELTEES